MAASVVVAGALANKARNGGEAWVRLSYVLGFRRLGCDVSFVEEIERPNAGAVDYFRTTTAAFGVAHASALVDPSGSPILGTPPPRSDLLVNVSGNARAESILAAGKRTAYVDIDPGYTQFWAESGELELPPHDVFFTIGENIGTATCSIPTVGIAWRRTRPPVVLEEWPAVDGSLGRFTTVARWRGAYGRVEFDGHRYGNKLDEFRKMLELPRRAPSREFEIALDIHPEEPDLERLREYGWNLVDPREVARDAQRFRSYVQHSGAEFSVAQGIYVETNSGWLSDRTTRYLASGKPVLVQETGFSQNLSVGEGVQTFTDLDEAVAGAEAIASDYSRHARAARELAETHFDSDRVLARLLEEALA